MKPVSSKIFDEPSKRMHRAIYNLLKSPINQIRYESEMIYQSPVSFIIDLVKDRIIEDRIIEDPMMKDIGWS